MILFFYIYKRRYSSFEPKVDEKLKDQIARRLMNKERDTNTKHSKNKRRCKNKSQLQEMRTPAGYYKEYEPRRGRKGIRSGGIDDQVAEGEPRRV